MCIESCPWRIEDHEPLEQWPQNSIVHRHGWLGIKRLKTEATFATAGSILNPVLFKSSDQIFFLEYLNHIFYKKFTTNARRVGTFFFGFALPIPQPPR